MKHVEAGAIFLLCVLAALLVMQLVGAGLDLATGHAYSKGVGMWSDMLDKIRGFSFSSRTTALPTVLTANQVDLSSMKSA